MKTKYLEELAFLNENDWFKAFRDAELVPGMPKLPTYNPHEDNTGHWRYLSGMREGYKLCLLHFGIDAIDDR